jgi:hypothetical protein
MGIKLDLELELESMLFLGEELDLTWNQIWFSQLELELKSNFFGGRTWPQNRIPNFIYV